MGSVGVILAMIGVVVCPITSGDTAFRSARLVLADWFNIDQESYANRLKLCVPVLGVGAFLGYGNSLGLFSYAVIWRYFSWTNQTLAMIVLWAGAMYLAQNKRNYWICAVPATFMSAVSMTYFIMAPECLGMIPALTSNTAVAYPAGLIIAAAFLVIFLTKAKNADKAPSKVA
jgi:carbon starvation protein CstA